MLHYVRHLNFIQDKHIHKRKTRPLDREDILYELRLQVLNLKRQVSGQESHSLST
jgi:hypothetical protein